MTERIAIIGGGITGLAAAYFALEKGHQVTLFESTGRLGGLAASFDFDGLTVEKYYHFICGGDHDLLDFAEKVGIGDRIRFRPTKLSFYYNGKIYPFGSPLNLLKFTPISLASRIKFGLNVITSKYTKNWESLDTISAKEWLISRIGEQAYRVIWHPLLKVKFGKFHDRISASWIWHRIHRVATSRKGPFSKEKLGYFVGGMEALIDAAADRIKEMNGEIRLKAKVQGLERKGGKFTVALPDGGEEYDKVMLAVPLPVAARLVEALDPDYARQLAAIDFIGVVCAVFRLKEPLNDAFWLNINDPRIPANGLIEYTNLNPLDGICSDRIVYVPFYVPLDDPWFGKDMNALREGFTAILKTVRPEMSVDAITGFRAFKSLHAQAICTMGFKDRVPSVAAPVEGLFLLDSTQLYPADRSMSALVGLAGSTVDRWL